eukprot:TRINITY_DN5232_c0_g6_i1.p1 TRINITY_DN5232_c0_g6~~TRINITY_DN5232_c0_g6_i1.p1  ORF type:complete len:233 (+),score=39.40 TRINITY_DN5232_c0_g6_i1:68-766(+)
MCIRDRYMGKLADQSAHTEFPSQNLLSSSKETTTTNEMTSTKKSIYERPPTNQSKSNNTLNTINTPTSITKEDSKVSHGHDDRITPQYLANINNISTYDRLKYIGNDAEKHAMNRGFSIDGTDRGKHPESNIPKYPKTSEYSRVAVKEREKNRDTGSKERYEDTRAQKLKNDIQANKANPSQLASIGKNIVQPKVLDFNVDFVLRNRGIVKKMILRPVSIREDRPPGMPSFE